MLKELWLSIPYKLDRTKLIVDSGSKTVHHDHVATLLDKFIEMIEVCNHTLNYASYHFPSGLGLKIFDYAKKGASFHVIGEFDLNANPIVYFFTREKLSDEEIEKIVQKKSSLLDRIDQTLSENNEFAKQKGAETANILSALLKGRHEQEKQRLAVNAKL